MLLSGDVRWPVLLVAAANMRSNVQVSRLSCAMLNLQITGACGLALETSTPRMSGSHSTWVSWPELHLSCCVVGWCKRWCASGVLLDMRFGHTW